jgi:excisionase family DNA binding protein
MTAPHQIVTVSYETLETLLSSNIEKMLRIAKGAKGVMDRKEAAEYLRISVPTLNYHVDTGELIATKLGKDKGREVFRLEDIEHFLMRKRETN